MVEFEVSKALPEISEEKLREVNNFLTNEMGVESEEDLKKITREDLTKNSLLSWNEADCLVKYWNTRYIRMTHANNWHVYAATSCSGVADDNDSRETTSSNSKTDRVDDDSSCFLF